ncbi:MAG: hypothetical protein E6K81_14610 [Candidatus Eisenbacteria bacterium]|uniref:DUF1801 domain-containing protein n=1 Tax=Eiseniibacteriota bacterium TaxID=2212470 RepID=A0A538U100_UNCEI|nr:MAG: hypothetical protein E6K81_14610 [Candidatus Eisenbacteria bacterium]
MSPAAASRRAKAGPAQRPKPARAVSARKPATAAKDDFAAVFATLEQILAPYESRALTRAGGRTGFWLNSGKVGPNKYQYAFAGVRLGKGYVSYYLMPVYMNAALQTKISPELKARMQGKACFNFKRPDPALFEELAALTEAGYQGFKKQGYIQRGRFPATSHPHLPWVSGDARGAVRSSRSARRRTESAGTPVRWPKRTNQDSARNPCPASSRHAPAYSAASGRPGRTASFSNWSAARDGSPAVRKSIASFSWSCAHAGSCLSAAMTSSGPARTSVSTGTVSKRKNRSGPGGAEAGRGR